MHFLLPGSPLVLLLLHLSEETQAKVAFEVDARGADLTFHLPRPHSHGQFACRLPIKYRKAGFCSAFRSKPMFVQHLSLESEFLCTCAVRQDFPVYRVGRVLSLYHPGAWCSCIALGSDSYARSRSE